MNEEKKTDNLSAFRQPLITATGIILGFALNVAATWLPVAFKSGSITDLFMAIGTLVHIPIYTIVLFRMLRMNYPREKAASYYRTTLNLFIAGIIFFYLTIVIIMFEKMVANR